MKQKPKLRVIDKEKLSQELIQELKKDAGYREFTDTQELSKTIGEAVSQARKKRKLSLAEIAKRTGKSEKILQRIEKGEYKQYTVKLLLDLARATNTKLKIELEG